MSIFRKNKPAGPQIVRNTVPVSELSSEGYDNIQSQPESSSLDSVDIELEQAVLSSERDLKNKAIIRSLVPFLLLLLIISLFAGWRTSTTKQTIITIDREVPVNTLDTSKLPMLPVEQDSGSVDEVVFNNRIISNGSLILTPRIQPSEPLPGEIYYDEDQGLKYYDGDNLKTVLVDLPQPLGVNDSPSFANVNLSEQLTVSNGGTGATSFSNNAVLIGNNTGAIATTNTPVAGQILVTDGSGTPQFVNLSGDVTITSSGNASLSQNSVGSNELTNTGVSAGTYGDASNYPVFTVNADGRITSSSVLSLPAGGGGVDAVNSLSGSLTLQGTANQVVVTSGGSTITLSTPQNIATSSSPTFSGLTISGLTNCDTIDTDGSGNLACGTDAGASGGITSINGESGSNQTLVTGTAGTDFAIVTTTDTNTFNLPDAGAASRGVISTGAQTIAGVKTFTSNLVTSASLVVGSTTFTEADLDALDDGVIDNSEVNDDLTISASGSVADGALSANVTLQGNTFNGVSQLVQLNGSGALTALNGANLTSLNATNISSGTLADGRLSVNVTLLGSDIDLASAEVTGTLDETNGGTGLATYTTGDILYSSAANTLSALAVGSNGECLVLAAGLPSWTGCPGDGVGISSLEGQTGATQTFTDDTNVTIVSAADTHVITWSGDLAVDRGGTGVSTFTDNGVIYGNGTGALSVTAVGATGQCLQGNTGAAPTWSACPGDGVGISSLGGQTGASQTFTNGTNVTISSSADNHTLGWTGQLAVADGGTGSGTAGGARTNLGAAAAGSNSDITALSGLTTALSVSQGGIGVNTLATNGVLYGNGTGAVQATGAGTTGQTLIANGSGVPVFVSLSGDLTVNASGVTTIGADAVALSTDTTGNYVATLTNGNGISGSSASEGGTPTIALGTLTTSWNQTGAFDIILDNANSELQIRGSGGAFYASLDAGALTVDETFTLPAGFAGTICTSAGNCAGVGGTGDILNNGQNGPITIGTNDATTLTLETSNAAALTITSTGASTFANTLTATGLTTLNGGLTVQAGDTFTFNGEAFTDLTGNGLTLSGNALTAQVAASADGLSTTTSSGSGLEVLSSGVTLLQGCADGEILKWNETTDVWACGADAGGAGVGDDVFVNGSGATNANFINTTATGAVAGTTFALATGPSPDEVTLTVSDASATLAGIVTANAQTFGGAKTFNALITGDLGLTVTGAAVNLNASSNFATNLNTGTSTGAVTIGGGSNTFALDSTNLDISTAGVISGATGVTSSGTITFSGLTADRLVTTTTGGQLTNTISSANLALSISDETGSGLAVFATSPTVSTLTVSSGGANITGNSTNTGNLTINTSTATDDQLVLSAATGGAARFNGTITNADLDANRTYTLPNETGTICLSSGNCAGVGGTGDILNNGQNGPITIGTNDATTLTLETSNAAALTITSTGASTFANTLTATGLTTLNGGLTVQAGDTFTFNGEAFTDLTGNGLTLSGNALTAQVAASADGLSTTTSSGSGLEVLSSGVTLLQGCADGEILKWNETTDVWACGADAGGAGVGDDVFVNGSGATNANFINTTATGAVAGTTFALATGPSPDEVTLTVSDASATLAGIVTANAQTFGGAKTFNALITGDLGLTVTGAAVNLNASSNFATNLNTGTSTGAVTIGGGSNTFALDSTNLDISTAGVISGATGVTSSGTITFSGLTADRLVTTTTGGQLTNTISSANLALSISDETGSGLAVFATSPTVSTLTVSSGGANITGNSTNTGNLTINTSTATDDQLVLSAATGGAARFNGTITNADLDANRTYTLPNETGTICLSSGNCAGVGGTGDILNNGQNGPITIGTNDATTLTLETSNAAALTITSTGASTFANTLTATGLTTLNGGLTVQAGDTFTFNGEAFTDLTGNGLTLSGNALTAQVAASADGLSTTTSSGSGLEVLSSGVTLLQGCADGEILKWNETTDVWACGADAGGAGVGDDVFVNGSGATNANFINTTATGAVAGTTFALATGPSPDEITLTVSDASATLAGIVTANAQTFGGAKTFNALITGDLGLTVTGAAVNLNASSNFATNLNTGTSTGAVTIGGGSNTFALDSTNLDISTAGVISGATGVTSSGTITFSGLTADRLVTTTTGGQLTNTISSANLALSISDETGSGLAVFATSPTVSTLTVSSGGANITGNSTNTGNLTINTSTATDDQLVLSAATGGAARFNGTITNADLDANRTYTLPNETGTICLSSGNCAGVGGTGDILNNGQNGPITIGTNDATTLTLETSNAAALTITSTGASTFANTLTATGLTTLNGGLTVQAGDTFTFNGEAFTDLTGNGLTLSGNALTAQVAASADGLSTTTSSGSGLEVLSSGVTLLQGCADGEILKWNETTDVWACGADAGGAGVGDDVFVNGSGATNANFINTTATGAVAGTTFALATGPSPDEVTLTVSDASATLAGIVTANAQTFGGAKTFNALITGDLGLTVTGAAVNLNASSNFATNLNTGTSTGAVTIGGGSNTFALDSTNLDISTAGVISGATGVTSSGTITFSGLTADRLVTTTTGGQLTNTISSANLALSISDETGSGLAVFATSPTVSTLTVSSGGANITGNSTNTGNLTINTSTATDDQLVLSAATGGAARFNGTITNADLDANRTYTLPNETGTICLSSGNCAGVGGTGDILNNGQNGPITIGTNDATTLTLETSNAAALTITSTGASTFANTLTATGLTTLNGGLTVQAGDTFTFNGEAFTDLTGNGLTLSGNALTAQVAASADGLSTTTSSGSGLEVLSSGVTLLQGCADGEILKWNETTDVWACGADAGGAGVGDDVFVNGSGATNANFINTTATGAVAGTTFALATGPSPDEITLTVSDASATLAGIVTANAQTFGGAKTFNALITGDLGLTVTGAAVNLNASSNFATNLNTGTSTGAVTIGGGSNTFALDSTNLDISTAGVISGATGVTSSGTITFSGLTADRLVTTTTGGQLTNTISSANLALSISDETGSGLAVFATSPTVSTLTVSSGGANITGNSTNTGSLTINTSTATDDQLVLSAATGGAARFNGTITNADLDANRTYTLPNETGTICLSSGNCAGVGGTGDILNNGQNGPITIGTNDATTLTLETSNAAALTITSTGASTFANTLTATGLTTLNGGLTVQAGDTFTFNGEAFTDLTGNGLTLSGNALTAQVAASADGLSTTTSSGSGLEVLSSGVTLLQGCADGEILKWNETTDVWACGADAGGAGVGDDVFVNGSGATNANFINTTATGAVAGTTFALATGPSPDEVTLTVSDASATLAGIVTANAQTFGGAKTFNALITGDLGLTVTGAAVNLNASSNFATNLNTGTSTGAVTIGGGSNTFALDSTNLDISTAGVISGATGVTSSGTITFSGLTADRLVTTTTGGQLTNTISSANLALSISDETGSGLAVFATSPTVSTLTVSSGGANITGNSTNTGNLTINTSTATDDQLVLSAATGGAARFNGTITNADLDANRTYTLPNETGTICLSSGNCAGVAGNNLQQAYTAGTDGIIQLDGTRNGIFIQDASSTVGDIFVVEDEAGTTDYLTVTNTATTVGGNLSVTGTTTFNGDVTVASTYELRLVGDTTANRPSAAGIAGTLYYDTNTNTLLVSNGTKWVADRGEYTIVAANDSTQVEKDSADYVTDGTADEVQINSALSAAAGGKVILLPGTYVAAATILIPNNTTLAGSGPGTIIELADLDIDENLIENSDTTTGTGVVIRDLKLDGRKDLNTAGNQIGIYFDGMGADTGREGANITDLQIDNFRTYAIQLEDSDNSEVRGVSARNNSDLGIVVNNSTYVIVSENEVYETGSFGAIYVGTASSIVVANNIIEDNVDDGIRFSSVTNSTISGNTISNNGVGLTTEAGIYVSSGGSNSITGNTITGQGGGGEAALWLFGTSDNTVTGNNISDNDATGILFSHQSDYNLVSGNTLHDNGGSVSAQHTIHFTETGGGGDYNVISNNYITDTIGGSRAIRIQATGGDYNVLSGNIIGEGSLGVWDANGPIEDLGTGTQYISQQVEGDTLQSGSSLLKAYGNRSLAGTGAATSTTTLTGTSTLFLSELQVGDRITTNTSETRTVTAIASNTSLTVDTAFTTFTGQAITRHPASLIVKDSSNNIDFIISDQGYVGIGKTAPTVALDVVGSSLISGTLGVTGLSTFDGNLRISDGSSNYATIDVSALAGDYTVSIPTITANDSFCLATVANCSGLGGLQAAYGIGNTITTTNARDIDFTLADTASDSNFDIVVASGSNGAFRIYNNATLAVSYDTTNGFYVPGLGSGSEQYGYGASTGSSAIISSLAVGNGATTTGDRAVAVGSGASAGLEQVAIGQTANSSSGVAIGHGATSSNQADVAIGTDAIAADTNNIAIGGAAQTNNNNSIAIGGGAQSLFIDAIAFGTSATTSGSSALAVGDTSTAGIRAVALGNASSASFDESIAIGSNATTTASNQLVVSSVSAGYFGNGVTNASPNSFTLNATGGSGTDIAGANLTVAGGRGTGTGTGGSIILQTAAAGGTGTALNALTTYYTLNSAGLLQGSNGATISVPGAGTSSEVLGSGATAAGNQTLVVGNGASASAATSVVLGYNASSTGVDNIVVGPSAAATGNWSVNISSGSSIGASSVLVGTGATVTGTNFVALGRGVNVEGGGVSIGDSANGSAGVAIGNTSIATGFQSTAIGRSSLADASNTVALGRAATASFNESIAIGSGAVTTAVNQLVVGSNTQEITSVFLGSGVTDATPSGFTLNATGGSGTDIAGANLTVAGGRGTGSGTGGSLIFQTAEAGGTGSSLNALTTRLTIDQAGLASFVNNVDIEGTLFAGTGDAFQVSAAGAVTAVGLNSGSGLIQGTGGATLTGATLLNSTGSGATTIGNASSTTNLGSSTINLTDGSFANCSLTTVGGVLTCGTDNGGTNEYTAVVGVNAGPNDSTNVAAADYTGDGTADDVQIQSAIDAVTAAGGGTVLLLEGTYDIAATINMKSNVVLKGSGFGTQLVAAAGLSGNIIAENTNPTNIEIRDLRIDGNRSVATSSTNSINMDTVGSGSGDTLVPGVVIDNVEIEDSEDYGIHFDDVKHSRINNVRVIDADDQTLYAGIAISGSSSTSNDIQITNSQIVGSDDEGITIGTNTSNIVIDSNVITGNSIGVNLASSSTEIVVSNNVITGNTSRGVNFTGSGSDKVITGNTIADNSGDGIGEGSSWTQSRITITDNNIDNNGSEGIFGIFTDSVIADNTFFNNEQAAIEEYTLGTGFTRVSITGNVIRGDTAGTNDTDYGIYLAGAGQENLISNNVISGVNTHGIALAANQNNTTVTNNRIIDTGLITTTADGISNAGDYNHITNNAFTEAAGAAGAYAIDIVSGADYTYLADNTFSLGGSVVAINDAGNNTIYANQARAGDTLQSGSSLLKAYGTRVLTGSIDPTASTTLTGVGTKFLTELQVGDRITVSAETRTVTAIASDTSLTVDTATTDTANDTSPDRLPASLIVRDSAGVNNIAVNDIGAVVLRNSTNSTAALRVENAAGNTAFNYDSTNGFFSFGIGGYDLDSNHSGAEFQITRSHATNSTQVLISNALSGGDAELQLAEGTSIDGVSLFYDGGANEFQLRTGTGGVIGTTRLTIARDSGNATFANTLTVQGASTTLGVASTTTGTAIFRNSGGAGGITLTPANPGASSYTLTLPAETGTLCSTGSVCTGYQTSGSYALTDLSNIASTNLGAALNKTAGDLALTTTTSGNVTLTPALGTGLVNVLTGNLKVGNGSPTNSLSGESAYIEGTLEVDGAVYFDGNIDLGDVSGDTISFIGSIDTNIIPSAASTLNVGSATSEINQLFVADDNGIVLGLDQDATIAYDETTDDRVELTGTGASLFIEDRLSFGVQTLTLTDDGTANDTLTPTATYVQIDIDAGADAGNPDLVISESSAKDGDLLIIVNTEPTGTHENFTITNSATVVNLPGATTLTLGTNDTITLLYVTDRWVTISNSNN